MQNYKAIKFGTLTQLTSCVIFLLKIGEMLPSY